MAAIFYNIPNSNTNVFKGGQTIYDSVHLGFLSSLIDSRSMVMISDVSMQNRDTIQYFLTFNDLVSYFYFGKGLGTLSISGFVLGSPDNLDNPTTTSFPGMANLLSRIGRIRGKEVSVLFGGHIFWCVLSSFTFRANAEDQNINMIEFNLQLDIINHTLRSPTFNSYC